ncbi:MAG: hypothetical protein U1C33_03895, partial [Candidatus Cloacimonadaceae bacterium]|nr:hypothetical protein [Candidatus Cloacimonadaceae bacterium]
VEQKPMCYTLSIILHGTSVINYQQLSGNETSFTVSKQLLEQYDYPDLGIYLSAVNYKKRGSDYLAYIRIHTGEIVSTSIPGS